MDYSFLPKRYWDYLILAIIIFVSLIIFYFLMSRLLKKYEHEKQQLKQVERIVNQIVEYSNNFIEFMTIFHSRSKFNPDKIDKIGESLTLNVSKMTSLVMLYFVRNKDVTNFNDVINKCNEHYTELQNRVVPPRPMSQIEFEAMRDDLNEQFTNLIKIAQEAKYI